VQLPGAAAGLRVVVADHRHLARRGLVEVLSAAGAVVVAEATDTESALRAVAEHAPRALLVALDLPGRDRGHVVAISRDRWPDLGVVALSEHGGREATQEALRLGASAHLGKDAAPERFPEVAAQAAAMPRAFHADVALELPRDPAPGRADLTPREREVLRLAGEGLTVRAISARLFVSDATTRSHLGSIYRKLGVSNRSQAVLAAARLGLLA